MAVKSSSKIRDIELLNLNVNQARLILRAASEMFTAAQETYQHAYDRYIKLVTELGLATQGPVRRKNKK